MQRRNFLASLLAMPIVGLVPSLPASWAFWRYDRWRTLVVREGQSVTLKAGRYRNVLVLGGRLFADAGASIDNLSVSGGQIGFMVADFDFMPSRIIHGIEGKSSTLELFYVESGQP